jgi:hypothetical protein
MASLLDMNFNDIDLDKLFGTTTNPVAGLITDPNFETSKNVSTFAPLITNVIREAYAQEKYIPEILAESYLLGGAGRQSAIDKATKSYMTQQDILKDTLAIQKAKGDLQMQPLEMLYKKGQIQQQPYDLNKIRADLKLKGLETIEKETRLQGYSNFINTLPPAMKNEFAAMGPEKFFEIHKITDEDRVMYDVFGIKDRFQMNPQQANLVARYNLYDEQGKVDEYNQKEREKAQDPLYKPQYKIGKLDFLKQVAARSGDPQQVSEIERNYKQASVPEGMVKLSNKKIISEEEYDALPYREKEYLDPDLDLVSFRKNKALVQKERRDDKKMIGYGMSGNRDVKQNIEKILDDPQALNELFTQTGRIRVRFNDATGGFIAEGGGVAADVARYLNSLKAKQFTQQIQFMRQNNPTGGAVGNVSDREVSMFQNMQEYLGDMGSGEKLYEALVDLYNKTEVMNNEYKELYIDDYGEKYWDESLQNREVEFKQYAPTLKQAIEGDKIDAANPQPIPQINTKEEALKLPKGTIFKTPDGKTRRR